MNSLFSIFNTSPLISGLIYGSLALLLVLLFFSVLLWRKQRILEKKLTLFFSGNDAKTLETVLTDQLKETQSLDHDIQELFDAVEKLRTLGLRGLHKHSVLRFNPFKEVGGNQSFCVALLDGNDSGVIISSLHTREGTRVYAKPVEKGGDQGFAFTEEEKDVIRKATLPK